MAIDISDVVGALLDQNRGPVKDDPDLRLAPTYGVAATFEGESIDLTLTFRTGCTYCCMEWSCHLGFFAGNRWQKPREALHLRGVTLPSHLRLKLQCVIEEGAMFFDLSCPDPRKRGWYAFKSATGCRLEVSVEEGTRE